MEQKAKNIHWFPGHMKKAGNEIEDKIKLVDFVIVLLDARAPIATFNNYLVDKTKNKRKLYLLNKCDLADEEQTKKRILRLKDENSDAIAVSLENNKYKNEINKKIEEFLALKKEKALNRGIKNITARAMVIGIPNVGKSTFINMMIGKKVLGAQNTPGFTKKITWAKVNNNFELLDTPGVLEPSFDSKEIAINLALIGSIKATILPNEELATFCLNFLRKYYLYEFLERFKIEYKETDTNYDILKKIAILRGLIKKGNELDINKSEVLLLKEFKDGKITHFTLERI